MYWQDGEGEWRPSKKGIALNEDTIDEVIEALKKARTQLINQINPINQSVHRAGKKIDDAELMDMVNQGKERKEIAEHFGVSTAAVCKRLKRLQSQVANPGIP